MKIYLAGAIRDGHPEDIEWREKLIGRLEKEGLMAAGLQILNPLGNKTYHPDKGIWTVGGVYAGARNIVGQDVWSVLHSDVIVANLLSLKDGYPTIGTLIEFGVAAGDSAKLVYSVYPTAEMMGKQNAQYQVHPFITTLSTEVFTDMEAITEFLVSHLPTLMGIKPRFAPNTATGGIK